MTADSGLVTLAALSFEERCLAATKQVLTKETKPVSIVLLDYGATATPGSEATSLRNAHWAAIDNEASEHGIACSRRAINAYSMADLEEIVYQNTRGERRLLVDISCMTRPHILALAVSLTKAKNVESWTVAYTKPLSYGDLNAPNASGGWRDTLWLPLGEDPLLRNEGLALGLLAVGHEADRAGIALREIEPAAGIAIYSRRVDRPDLHRAALEKNRLLFSYLRQLRMPGPRGQAVKRFFRDGGWEIVGVRMERVVEDVARVAARVVRAAVALDSPIVFIPFGPKLVVLIVAWLLARECPDRSWAIYPVARTHPLGYSDGVLATDLLDGSVLEATRVNQAWSAE